MSVFQKLTISSILVVGLFCDCHQENKYSSPDGYDLTNPEKIILPHSLDEISGIVFKKGDYEHIYAIEDESGKLYKYDLSSKTLTKTKFYTKGDYEDLTIYEDSIFVVLKSNGELYTFPIAGSEKENIDNVTAIKDLLPTGEYEALFSKGDNLYILCKDCKGDDDKKEVTIYELQAPTWESQTKLNPIKINFSKIRKATNEKKESFHPSCLAFHPITHEWFIISSINNKLLIVDEQWNSKAMYDLNPENFKQPEGIAFNDKGDLFISNEASGGTANIQRINYHPSTKK